MSGEGVPEIRGLRTRIVVWLLHRVFKLTRGMTLGVRAACFDGEGRIFLVRHTYVPGWYMPGGGVERGETALDALRKELREEETSRSAARSSFSTPTTTAMSASGTTCCSIGLRWNRPRRVCRTGRLPRAGSLRSVRCRRIRPRRRCGGCGNWAGRRRGRITGEGAC